MTAKKLYLILSIVIAVMTITPTLYFGQGAIISAMEEITENTRYRLNSTLEYLERRMWHLEQNYPDEAAYPPGHIEEMIRIDRQIEELKIQLGYTVKE